MSNWRHANAKLLPAQLYWLCDRRMQEELWDSPTTLSAEEVGFMLDLMEKLWEKMSPAEREWWEAPL